MIASAGSPVSIILPRTSRPWFVFSSPALDPVDQVGERLGPDRELGERQLLLLDRPEHVLLDPVARELELAGRPGDGVVVVGDVLPLLDQDVGVVGRQAVLGLEPLPARGGQLADRRPDPVDPGLVDDHGDEVGLGEIAVVGGGLLLALGLGDARRRRSSRGSPWGRP